MKSSDTEVLLSALLWLNAGRRVQLVTVVQTWGSSPRPVGSMLALRDDGKAVGSVSGGCIEDDLIAQVRRDGISEGASPSVIDYGVTADEAHRFGLPCGGTIRLVQETLDSASATSDLVEKVGAGRLVARVLDMKTGRVALRLAQATDEARFDGLTLTTVHGPRYRMLLIGGGQLSRYVANIAVGLDYEVTVCDPRDEYDDDWHLPNVRRVRTMPDDTVTEMGLDARSAVIALTHDPKLDDLALMEALRTDAFYVGAIGSRRNSATRRKRLRLFDLGDRELARLRGPVGLYIGGRTPPEIALSILAEVTACRNNIEIVRMLDVAAGKVLEADRARIHA